MPQIQAGETFVVGQQFTATRANNHVNGAILLPGAVGDQIAASPPGGGFDLTNIEFIGKDVTLNQLRKYTFPDIFNQINTPGFNVTAQGVNIESTTGPLTISNTFLGTIGDTTTPGFILQWSGGGGTITSPAGFEFVSTDVEVGGNLNVDGTVDANGDVTLSSDLKLSSTSKVLYENPASPGNYIDVTDNVKTSNARLYDIEINEVPFVHVDANAGNRYSAGAPWPDGWNQMIATTASNRYTFTYVVPAGEKWMVEHDFAVAWSTDDYFGIAWIINGVQAKGFMSDSYHTGDYGRTINEACKFRKIFTAGTYTVVIKSGFFGGSGGDAHTFQGNYGTMLPLDSHERKWQEVIHKFKI